MNSTLVAVNFNNQTLTATLVNGIPHVALKPICENLGIDWEAQNQRIKRHPVLNSVACMIKATAADGKMYEFLMLPIKFLNGWLFGIDANRVKAEAKEPVIKYQIECFEVLANHFMPKAQAQAKINFDKPKPVLTQKVYDCWYKMVEIFGNQLLNEYGTDIPEIWMEAIEELTPEQIKCGFEGIKKSRSPFTPRLPVFLAYCHEKDVVSAKHKDMELVDKKKQIVIPCESREDILKHVEFQEMRINGFIDLLNGMKRSTEIIKGALQA